MHVGQVTRDAGPEEREDQRDGAQAMGHVVHGDNVGGGTSQLEHAVPGTGPGAQEAGGFCQAPHAMMSAMTDDVLRYAAFTDRPSGGNPAGVVLDAAGMDDAPMLAVAAELGYSETAFLTGGEGPSRGPLLQPAVRGAVLRPRDRRHRRGARRAQRGGRGGLPDRGGPVP